MEPLDKASSFCHNAAMTKFASLKDEVLYRACNNGFCAEELGTVEDIGWHGLLLNFYGYDYIVTEDGMGFVSVKRFDTHFEWEDEIWRSAESGNAWVEIFDELRSFHAQFDDMETWDD